MDSKFNNKLYKLWVNARYFHKGEFCKDWDLYINFENWAYLNGYENGARLKRIDKTKLYQPDNCHFLLGKTEYNTPLYREWVKMKYRSNYEVCSEWTQFPNFEVWALKNGYKPGYKVAIVNAYKYNVFTGESTYIWHPITTKFIVKK